MCCLTKNFNSFYLGRGVLFFLSRSTKIFLHAYSSRISLWYSQVSHFILLCFFFLPNLLEFIIVSSFKLYIQACLYTRKFFIFICKIIAFHPSSTSVSVCKAIICILNLWSHPCLSFIFSISIFVLFFDWFLFPGISCY